MSDRKKTTSAADREENEVEELLRAAEEDLLLKMTVNSHMARGSSSQFIDPDLDRRFQALKSNRKSQPQPKQSPSRNHHKTDPDSKTPTISAAATSGDDTDDLFSRFAALKKSLPTYQQHTYEESGSGDDECEEEDEVEKVIKWAMDAARLDPSPPSDSDDGGEDDGHDSEDDNVRFVRRGKKGANNKNK